MKLVEEKEHGPILKIENYEDSSFLKLFFFLGATIAKCLHLYLFYKYG